VHEEISATGTTLSNGSYVFCEIGTSCNSCTLRPGPNTPRANRKTACDDGGEAYKNFMHFACKVQ